MPANYSFLGNVLRNVRNAIGKVTNVVLSLPLHGGEDVVEKNVFRHRSCKQEGGQWPLSTVC